MAPAMVGTAAWTIPARHANSFPAEGSHLERYARVPGRRDQLLLYRPHRPTTYQRWASTVPAFRFAVKMPPGDHALRRLATRREPLARFLAETGALGEKLGPLVLQLPPRFAFETAVAAFLERCGARTTGRRRV